MEEILIALEQLGQAFPWEKVQIWTQRTPEGKISFVSYIDGTVDGVSNAFGSVIAHADDLGELVRNTVQHAGEHDPEQRRQKVIREMEEKIARLKATEFSLPPYVPNRELCERNPILTGYRRTSHQTIDL